MAWYWIVLITYMVMGTITTLIALFGDDDWALCWAAGLPCVILNVLSYPYMAWRKWNRSRDYYLQNGIKCWQFILGKRVKRQK